MCADATDQQFGPWNPGLKSQLPREYLPLSTMYRPENVLTGVEEAAELGDFCGLPAHKLVMFRAERLIVHELLVRVTADLAVPDGSKYEDLGINFRQTTSIILDKYISPHFAEISERYEQLRKQAQACAIEELSRELLPLSADAAGVAEPPARSWFSWLAGSQEKPAQGPETSEDRQARVVGEWRARRAGAAPLEAACLDALIKIVTAVAGKRGRLVGDRELIARMAVTLVCNDYGSRMIGEAIESHILEAVEAEGFRLLPVQAKPVVMNVKGASAAGKSTMRPLQKKLAQRINVPWDDFALISPDIWRKFLLDYDTLGDAYKYAGTMSGHELEIIDKKLDRYMAAKAADGRMSHLLIDRFRFDSFVLEPDREEGSNLLTRFGDLIYMFFVITPPDATVERAWQRGLKFGRYKAVDDLLDHNVEAFTGMPDLFFTWALRADKRVHFEFLDNSVPIGELPRTVAFGWNDEINILDVSRMIDVDRFRKININADSPREVYAEGTDEPADNIAFLKQCAERLPVVNFADWQTGQPYARLEGGMQTWCGKKLLKQAQADTVTRAGLDALGVCIDDVACTSSDAPACLLPEKTHTLGAWAPQIAVSTA
ncbi:MAG: hypothetical protein HKN11_00195 [Rhizobiales bacterium]|nr:hypothetical protein [Hyphomicrobiales bacterium]